MWRSIACLQLAACVVYRVGALQYDGAEEWPWSRKQQKAKAVEPAKEDASVPPPMQAQEDAAVPPPMQPGCYMRMPSGCPKKPMNPMAWRRDPWADRQGADSAACQARKQVWDRYCESTDAKMVYVEKAASTISSEPVSALQPVGDNDSEWPRRSGSRMAKVQEKVTEKAKAVVRDDDNDEDPHFTDEVFNEYPSTPGCYMRMPSGCPLKPMKTHMWRRDLWAEQHELGHWGCKARKYVWDKYCGVKDGKVVFVANATDSTDAADPNETSPAALTPVSALQLDGADEWQWPRWKQGKNWSKKRAEQLKKIFKRSHKKKARQLIKDVDADVINHWPSEPGCFMRMPSGCPARPMKTHQWRRDTWAEKHGLDREGCKARKRVWDKYCESDDSKMVFIANETASEAPQEAAGTSEAPKEAASEAPREAASASEAASETAGTPP